MQLNWRDDKQQQLEFELDKVHTFLDIDWIYRGKVHRRHSYPENGENYHVILQPNQWSSQTIPTQSWGTIKIDFLTVADPPLPYQRHIHSVHQDGNNIYGKRLHECATTIPTRFQPQFYVQISGREVTLRGHITLSPAVA